MWPLRPSFLGAFLLFIPRTKEKKMNLSTYFSAFADRLLSLSAKPQGPSYHQESSLVGGTHPFSHSFSSEASFRLVVFCLVVSVA
jgi:hypothetical protein